MREQILEHASDLGTVTPGGSIKLGVAIACECIENQVTSYNHDRSYLNLHLSKSSNSYTEHSVIQWPSPPNVF